jgi:hypothetical protein
MADEKQLAYAVTMKLVVRVPESAVGWSVEFPDEPDWEIIGEAIRRAVDERSDHEIADELCSGWERDPELDEPAPESDEI